MSLETVGRCVTIEEAVEAARQQVTENPCSRFCECGSGERSKALGTHELGAAGRAVRAPHYCVHVGTRGVGSS